MEAMILGYPPEQAGQISVTATKEEWADILRFIKESPYWPPVNDPVIDFILELHERGVRE